MKKPLILEELLIWLRGRFSLNGEEKLWLLMILIIVWAGLVGRTIHIKNSTPEMLSPQEVSELMMGAE